MRSHDKHPQRKMHHAKEEEFIKIHYQSLTVYVFDSHFRITLLVVRLRKKERKVRNRVFRQSDGTSKRAQDERAAKKTPRKKKKRSTIFGSHITSLGITI